MDNPTIKNFIMESLSKNVDFDETWVFLFGSRAYDKKPSRSDFDIGLYRGSVIPLSTVGKIRSEIDDKPIPVHVDLIDFATVTPDFKRIALKKIQVWNQPKKNLKLI